MQGADAAPVRIVGSQLSSIQADGDNVYVLWQNNSPDQNIYFRKSADNGNSFDDIIRISNTQIDDPNNSGFGFAAGALMAVPIEKKGTKDDGDTGARHVYIAWMNRYLDDLHSKVLFRSSSDGGDTFGEPLSLTDGGFAGDSGIQQLFASGSNVYAVLINEWTDRNYAADSYYYDIVLRVSTDNGKTFGESVRLIPDLSNRSLRGELSVGISPFGDNKHDAIYVAWVDHGSCTVEQVKCDQIKIFFRKSTDSGKTFSSPIEIKRPEEALDYDKTHRSPEPMDLQVAGSADGRNVYVVWAESIIKEDEQRIFLAMSSDGGVSFSDPVNLSASGSSYSPRLIVTPYYYGDDDDLNNTTQGDNGTVYIAWEYHPDDDGSSQSADESPRVVLLKSSDDGNSFGGPIDVIQGRPSHFWDISTVASQLAGDRIYITWHNRTQNMSGLPGGNDIYFRASVDDNWRFGNVLDLSDDVVLKTLLAAQNKALSFVAPQIVTSPGGNHVYVAWQASYPDSSEIYVRASADGGQSFGRIISLNEQTKDPISKSLAAGSSSPFFGQILTPLGLAISGIGFAVAGMAAFLIVRRRKRN